MRIGGKTVEYYNTAQATWVPYAGEVRFLPDEMGILITTKDITRNKAEVDPATYHAPRKDQPILTIDPSNGDTAVAHIRFYASFEMDVRGTGCFGKRDSSAGASASPTVQAIRRAVATGNRFRVRVMHHSVLGYGVMGAAALIKFGDALCQTSGWILNGVEVGPSGNTGEISTGTGSYGRLTAQVLYTGGVYKVEVFKHDLADKVAEGSIATPNGTVTLSQVSGSGLSGSVDIEYRQNAGDIVLQAYDLRVDEQIELEAYAKSKRDALEAMAVSGCPVIPWISAGYDLGDVITEVDGRELSLQANVTSTAADKRYPQVVGVVWHLDEEQSTRLLLDDDRQEG